MFKKILDKNYETYRLHSFRFTLFSVSSSCSTETDNATIHFSIPFAYSDKSS